MKKTNVPGSQSFGQKLLQFIRNNTVPIMFILICAYCIPQAGFSWSYLLNEVMTRLGRNAFLILSLLIPVMAGMGMNFGMTLGAMAGEIGLIFAADWQVWGIPGMILAAIVSIPIGRDDRQDPEPLQGPGDDHQLYDLLYHERRVSVCSAVYDGTHHSHRS